MLTLAQKFVQECLDLQEERERERRYRGEIERVGERGERVFSLGFISRLGNPMKSGVGSAWRLE